MEFRWPIRVYIEDTDAGGIVYYVNYLKFLERARTEFLRHLGFGKAAVMDSGCMFVVADISLKYRRPARLDDQLDATAELTFLGRAGMVFRQAVWRGDELLCDGDIKIACVDQTMRPTRIPTAIQQRLAAVS